METVVSVRIGKARKTQVKKESRKELVHMGEGGWEERGVVVAVEKKLEEKRAGTHWRT